MKTKNKLVVQSIAIKEEAKNFVLIKKRHIKGEKQITPMILQNILENQTFQRIAKFIMVGFHEMDFMKGIGSKSRWDVQYLEVC